MIDELRSAVSSAASKAVLFDAQRTLVDILRDRAEKQSGEKIYTFLYGDEQQFLTYAGLDARARVVAVRVAETCKPGDRALLLYPPGLDYIVALFGCMYAGVIAVPAYAPRPNRPLSRLESIVTNCNPAVALTTQEMLRSPRSVFQQQEGPVALLPRLATDLIGDDDSAKIPERDTSADTPVLLQFTSGSTASPKGVILSHGNIIHNTTMIQENFPLTPESSTVFWLPPYHDMGLIGGILQPLCTGFPVYLLSPVAFLQRPARWLQAISQFHATCSGGPNFAYDLCVRRISDEEIDELDLSSWAVAFNGSEPIRKQTLDDFCTKFGRCGFHRSSLHPCYGLAEATLMATGIDSDQGMHFRTVSRTALEANEVKLLAHEDDTCVLVSCGHPTGGQDLRIVDPLTSGVCEPDRIGEIWVSGPSVAKGYWGRPDETRETFDAHLRDGTSPFLRTGDLGFLSDGELYITGRIKDLIIIRGQNHYPHDIEFTAQRSHPALHASGTAAFSVLRDGTERLIMIQEIDARWSMDWPEITAKVTAAVSEVHDIHLDEIVPVRVWTIPRTTSGKIQRYLCRAAYLAGTLATIS